MLVRLSKSSGSQFAFPFVVLFLDTKDVKIVGTITAHHLYLTSDDSHRDPLAFCKPIPKKPSDRDALIKAACSGDPKFFLYVSPYSIESYLSKSYIYSSGSDSAPHPLRSKLKTQSDQVVPAGVFTQPFATQLVILALEEAIERGVLSEEEVTQDRLEQFLSRSGRGFYKLPDPASMGHTRIMLERKRGTIPANIKSADGALEIGLSRSMAPVFNLSWLR